MSLLQDVVKFTETVEGLNGVHEALTKFVDADGVLETAAAASQLVAELAITTAVTGTVRIAMSEVRLGLAISGQIWKWEALSWAAGATAGLSAGALIDAINDQHIGSWLYDQLHPYNVPFNSALDFIQPPRIDPLTLARISHEYWKAPVRSCRR